MGLGINEALMLIFAHRNGASFKRTLTFGRVHNAVFYHKLAKVLDENGISSKGLLDKNAVYADEFFKCLGAETLDSLDITPHEGATVVHDMNYPVPEELKGRYDFLYDGGSIEHVFNLPTALKNCMEVLRVGGSLVITTAANNLFGHGLFQISADLFWTVFHPSNGFEVQIMLLYSISPYGRWYAISNPEVIRSRVELISHVPMLIAVHATKTAEKHVFGEAFPQQSDYSGSWIKEGTYVKEKPSGLLLAAAGALKDRLPKLARLLSAINYAFLYYSTQSILNRKYFKPIKKTAASFRTTQ